MQNQKETHRRPSRPKETAEYFGISIVTLWRWAQDPAFPSPVKRGRIVLYDIVAINRWLSGGEVA